MKNYQMVQMLSTEFLPKNDYLLIKPTKLATEKLTAAGVIIPLGIRTSPTNRDTFGKIVEVGRDIGDLAVGDFVLWPETDGLDIEFTDGEFLLLRYKSVIGTKK